MNGYDVIIVGAGPSGIFTALELVKKDSGLNILILEKGKDIERRSCPSRERNIKCIHCNPCSVLCGWGGSGAFSDGKLTLTLSSEVGGQLSHYIENNSSFDGRNGNDDLDSLLHYTDQIFLDFGAPTKVYGIDSDEINNLQRKASLAELRYIPVPIRHLGTERCSEILQRMKNFLEGKVEIRTEVEVDRILTENSLVTGVHTKSGEEIKGTYVVVAPGREGAGWLSKEAKRLGLELTRNPVDVGVRVELPAVVFEPLTEIAYEPKLIYYSKSFDDKVRIFCVCPYGEVVTERIEDILTVNGHSYANRRTQNTNFAILVSKTFTEPFKEPIAYGRYIARLANLLGDGVIVQRLGDLEAGRRTNEERLAKGMVIPTLKEATPGDLGLVLPYRHLTNIREMLSALDKLAEGVCSRHTLLYGVEVKFYSSKLKLSECLETQITNLFATGDGAGVTRGLMQSSASGIVVAREILSRT